MSSHSRRSARYLRRSKKLTAQEKASGQSTVSVEDQRTRTTALEEREGYEHVREFVDDGISAWREDADRKAFKALCELISSGGVDVVIADAPDRLSRLGGEAYLAFRRLCHANGVKIHTVSNGLDDPEDDNAEIPAYLSGWVANKESKDKSRRLKNRMTEMANQGLGRGAGPRPFGWAQDRIALHPQESALLRAAAARIMKGGSLAGVVRKWNDAGISTTRDGYWTISALRAALTRPRNAGLVVLRGSVVEGVQGKWEPLWDLSTHQGLVALLGSKGGGRQPLKYLLSGILRCQCGEIMSASSGGTGVPVYRCTVHTKRFPKGDMEHCSLMRDSADEKALEALLSALLLGPMEEFPEDPETLTLAALYVALDEVSVQRENLKKSVLLGVFSDDELVAESKAIKAEENRLLAEIQEVTENNARAALLTDMRRELWQDGKVSFSRAAEVKKKLRERFLAMDVEDQKTLMRAYLELTVSPSGRGEGKKGSYGVKRLRIRHLIATELNDE